MLASNQESIVKIKVQSYSEPTFTERFITVMSRIEAPSPVSKDSIFQLIGLCYEDNRLFLELFQKAFLLVFQAYTGDCRLYKSSYQQTIKQYSDFIELFLVQMICMQRQVKRTPENLGCFLNFFDFFISFFTEAICSAKSFMKEFSFVMLNLSLRLIHENLMMDFSPQIQQELLDSVFYLLTSKSEDNKKMGVDLYSTIKKLKIKSQQVNELLLEYLETLQNYSLRKVIIQSGIDLDYEENLDRFLYRLKDKNPFIVEEVIQKLMDEKLAFRALKFQQKTKLIVQGFGSCHENVRNKTLKYISDSFLQILNQKQESPSQFENNDPNLSIISSQIEEAEKPSKIKKLIGIFNYDCLALQTFAMFRESPFISGLVSELVFKIFERFIPFEMIESIFVEAIKSIEQNALKSEEAIFLQSLLSGIYSMNSTQRDEDSRSKKNFQKLLLNSIQLLSPQAIMYCLKQIFNTCDKKTLVTKLYFMKVIELLMVRLDVYDCVGQKIVYEELITILSEINFFQTKPKIIDQVNLKQDRKFKEYKDHIIYLNLAKANWLIGAKDNFINSHLWIVTSQADIIFPLVGLIHELLVKEPSCESGQLRILTIRFIQNKELKLQRETINTMHKKTSHQMKNAQQNNQQSENKKTLAHFTLLNKEISNKLLQNERKIVSNNMKGFFILAKILSIKDKYSKIHTSPQYLAQYNASNFIQLLKTHLFNTVNILYFGQDSSQMQIRYVLYVLLYHYCSQSKVNFDSFKKLFTYYAFQIVNQPIKPEDHLLKLLCSRILVELEVMYAGDKQHGKSSIDQIIQSLWNNIFRDDTQLFYLEQIVLKAISDMCGKSTKNYFFLSKLLVLAIKDQLTSSNSHDFNINRTLMLIFQKVSHFDPNLSLKALLSVWYLFIHFSTNSADQTFNQNKKGRQVFLFQVSKIIIQLVGEIFGSIRELPQNNRINFLLLHLPLFLKMFSEGEGNMYMIPLINLKQVCIKFFLKQGEKSQIQQINVCLLFQHAQIQLLIFVKSQIQKCLEKLKQIQFSGSFLPVQTAISNFKQSLEELDQSIEQEIIKISQQKANCNRYEQESTQNSPLIIENQQKVKNDLQQKDSKLKIDSGKVETYKRILSQNIQEISLIGKSILDQLKTTQFYTKFCEDIEKLKDLNQTMYCKKNEPNSSTNQNQVKVEQTLPINVQKVQTQDTKANQIEEIFDRRGRRKVSHSNRYDSYNLELKATIKRSRFIVIPYEIVEEAENKFCSQKKTHFGSKSSIKDVKRIKDKEDKPFRYYRKSRNLSSKQVSNQSQGEDSLMEEANSS